MQLYAKPKGKKTGCAAALGAEFVWKEIKILMNKIFHGIWFPNTCYQVFWGERIGRTPVLHIK